MDDGRRLGERRIRFVMVRNDEGDAAFLGHLGLVNTCNPAIDRDNDVRLLFRRNAPHGRFVQSVPLFRAAGQVMVDICPQQGQSSLQNRGPGHPVDVVIAVHDNSLLRLDRLVQDFGGLHTTRADFPARSET